MSLRSRQSTAAVTPGPSTLRASTAAPASSGATFPLPDYQPPSHPLTAQARDQLIALSREFPAQGLTRQYQDVLKLVSAQAGNVAEEIYGITVEKNIRKRRAEKHGEDLDEDVENRADESIAQVERMIERMESATRRGIDGEHAISIVDKALREIHTNASVAPRSSQRQTQTQTQTQAQTQNSRVTLDGPSQSDPSTQPPPPELITLFSHSIDNQTDRYDAQSLATRYAQHPIYAGFKRGTHEARHGTEGPPLEHANRWFARTSAAQPGVTGAASDAEDDDIAVARVTVSTKCPLTLREFEEPLTSKRCPHSFEKSAILELLAHAQPPAGRRAATAGWTPTVECPVPGCSQRLGEADLWENDAHKESIRRAKRLEAIRREMAAEDGAEDAGPGEMIDSGSEDGVEDMDADGNVAASVAVKRERVRQVEEIQETGAGSEDEEV